jgi:pyruvate dehydrogenase (quinone)
MPPTITLEPATGFGVFMLKAVLSGRGDEIVDLAEDQIDSRRISLERTTRYR